MDSAIDAVSNKAREKNVTINRIYLDNPGKVKADADKTGWVLNNFLTNAIKYSSEVSTIDVSVRQSGNSVEFSVRDHGPGIPQEYISKVFDRFFKVPGSKAGGTGLGLSISKEFIEAQGGKIWVRSEVGTGSTFGFNLPVTSTSS
jgi:signal transduction histidine kinase